MMLAWQLSMLHFVRMRDQAGRVQQSVGQATQKAGRIYLYKDNVISCNLHSGFQLAMSGKNEFAWMAHPKLI